MTTNTGSLGPYIESFDLVLRVNDKSVRTREMYTGIARWFAGWLTDADVHRWSDVGRDELRQFFLHIDDLGYAKSYRNNIGRCLQRSSSGSPTKKSCRTRSHR